MSNVEARKENKQKKGCRPAFTFQICDRGH